ncbi:MAG: hypothetical protein AB1918_05150 [Pseudomonadota bacterium]
MKRLLLALSLALVAAPAGAATLEPPRDWQPPPIERIPNHRQLWRDVLVELSTYAKGRNKDFIVLAREGVELLVKGEREAEWEQERDPEGLTFEKRLPLKWVFRDYVRVLDGMVVDGLYCGPFAFDKPLAEAIKDRKDLDAVLAEERARGIVRPPVPVPMGPFSIDPKEELRKHKEWRQKLERHERQRRVLYAVDAMRANGRRILSIEDCASRKEAEAALRASDRDRVLTFAGAGIGRLDTIPKGFAHRENAEPVRTVTAARNWLPMVRGDKYATKAEWLMALEQTNDDMLLIDVAHRGSDPLTKEEVRRLKFKQLGSARLVLAVLPVGTAHDWRLYWQKGWRAGQPPFLFAPDPDQPGTFYTDLESAEWKQILGKYVAWIVDLGFDGIVFDDLDTYLWFEELMPLRN